MLTYRAGRRPVLAQGCSRQSGAWATCVHVAFFMSVMRKQSISSIITPMQYFTWLLRFILFLLLLGFALKNSELVRVSYYLGMEWQAPLVLVVLAAFALGMVVALIALSGQLFRLKREVRRLHQALHGKAEEGGNGV